jgi:tetratricopeptide (TPR) repeat protein
MLRLRFSFFLCVLALCCCSSSAKIRAWTEVKSPHFRVLTDGGVGNAKRIAREFEQMRAVFETSFPNMTLGPASPLLIFAPENETSMKSLAPAQWKRGSPNVAGFFQNGWERQFAVIRLDQDIPGAYQVVYHEYVHTLLHANFRWLPQWLDEGLAEFYGGTRFETSRVYVGAPTTRVLHLRGTPLIPLEKLISQNPYVAFRGDDDRIDVFYGESWALVHYFTFAPGMENGKKITQFYSKVQRGEEQKKAFAECFGNFDDVQSALERYVRNFAFSSYVTKTPVQIDEKQFQSRKLSLAETAAAIGSYRIWSRDYSEAFEITEQGLAENPKLADLHENMGFLKFSEGNDQEAVREFSTAYELDNQLYLSLFFKTMMSPASWSDSPADLDGLYENLLRVLKTNPRYAEAFTRMAFVHLRKGDLATALGVSRKAEQLEPSRAGYHLLSGKILLRLGKGAEAAEFAKYVADRWRGPDHDEAMELWGAVPESQRPAAQFPMEVVAAGQLAEGSVKSTDCGDKTRPASITIASDGKPLTFDTSGNHIIGYSDTLWYGTDHFSPCHHLEGLRAIVRYQSATEKQFAGKVTALELREDLPVAVIGGNVEKNMTSPAPN